MKKHFGFTARGSCKRIVQVIILVWLAASCSKGGALLTDEYVPQAGGMESGDLASAGGGESGDPYAAGGGESGDLAVSNNPPVVVPVISMIINEVRIAYRGPPNYVVEFVEFRMLSTRNLGGLRLFIASNESNPVVFEFPPVEAQKGEFVVVHLRTLSEESVNELTSDLSESGGPSSSPYARDFWVPGNERRVRPNDAIYVKDENGAVVTALMIIDLDNTPVMPVFLYEAARFLFSKGAWMSLGGGPPISPADAFDIGVARGLTLTRTISRDESVENTNTAADWYITRTHGATPGEPNAPPF